MKTTMMHSLLQIHAAVSPLEAYPEEKIPREVRHDGCNVLLWPASCIKCDHLVRCANILVAYQTANTPRCERCTAASQTAAPRRPEIQATAPIPAGLVSPRHTMRDPRRTQPRPKPLPELVAVSGDRQAYARGKNTSARLGATPCFLATRIPGKCGHRVPCATIFEDIKTGYDPYPTVKSVPCTP
ncbi:hypothetical protein GGR50DRAFT_275656 [Xylaria sp. CBS 124048]|nr:hypothetical protein GGR50DRAFT_275656 [Xylaria sp. CBS 124048]